MIAQHKLFLGYGGCWGDDLLVEAGEKGYWDQKKGFTGFFTLTRIWSPIFPRHHNPQAGHLHKVREKRHHPFQREYRVHQHTIPPETNSNDFLVCSKFNHMQRDCPCACAVACFCPHNSIWNVVASVRIHDHMKIKDIECGKEMPQLTKRRSP